MATIEFGVFEPALFQLVKRGIRGDAANKNNAPKLLISYRRSDQTAASYNARLTMKGRVTRKNPIVPRRGIFRTGSIRRSTSDRI